MERFRLTQMRWINRLIQKCVLRGEASLVHGYKAQNSELVLIKPAKVFIVNLPEQGFYPKISLLCNFKSLSSHS